MKIEPFELMNMLWFVIGEEFYVAVMMMVSMFVVAETMGIMIMGVG